MAALASGADRPVFTTPASGYHDDPATGLLQTLASRVAAEPFNLVATTIFLLAILHTFLAPAFLRMSHRVEKRHRARLSSEAKTAGEGSPRGEVSFAAEMLHFLGEIEAVFGIWVVPLLLSIVATKGWPVARDYLGEGLNFAEPLFVVVIMTIAASRPILHLAEKLMAIGARLGRGSPAAWWFSILTIGPLLGSFITEPAAMTISALLIGRRVYELRPSARLAYATLGLLFVNVSVGGTLTHFAAPPVLMVAGKWGWGLSHMLTHFGWKAVLGIGVANVVYYMAFRGELSRLGNVPLMAGKGGSAADAVPVPVWITIVHILFLAWTVANNHYPALFIGGFLFYLAFLQATEHHQGDLNLRPAMLVGFFLAGLVVHGGLQGWWIAPVLGGLKEVPLFLGAGLLTAFNDNAAITYLASFVPNFSPPMQQAVVAGAVVGGGLTVIANAPNPAGQSVLAKYFPEGVSALGLLLGALAPTLIIGTVFLVFR